MLSAMAKRHGNELFLSFQHFVGIKMSFETIKLFFQCFDIIANDIT